MQEDVLRRAGIEVQYVVEPDGVESIFFRQIVYWHTEEMTIIIRTINTNLEVILLLLLLLPLLLLLITKTSNTIYSNYWCSYEYY